MDQTGHTTLAEWTAEDPASVEAAVAAFRAQLDQGYYAVVSRAKVTPSRCASCRSTPPS